MKKKVLKKIKRFMVILKKFVKKFDPDLKEFRTSKCIPMFKSESFQDIRHKVLANDELPGGF